MNFLGITMTNDYLLGFKHGSAVTLLGVIAIILIVTFTVKWPHE